MRKSQVAEEIKYVGIVGANLRSRRGRKFQNLSRRVAAIVQWR